MKNLLIATAIIALAISAQSGELVASYVDTITESDSAGVRVDTVYSSWELMDEGRFLNCGVQAVGAVGDTNWVNDFYFCDLQMSFNGLDGISKILTIDTLLDVGEALSGVNFDAADSSLPPWARLRVIHIDTINAGDADSALVASSMYEKTFKLFYNWR